MTPHQAQPSNSSYNNNNNIIKKNGIVIDKDECIESSMVDNEEMEEQRKNSLTRDKVARIMREQDAELLESMHLSHKMQKRRKDGGYNSPQLDSEDSSQENSDQDNDSSPLGADEEDGETMSTAGSTRSTTGPEENAGTGEGIETEGGADAGAGSGEASGEASGEESGEEEGEGNGAVVATTTDFMTCCVKRRNSRKMKNNTIMTTTTDSSVAIVKNVDDGEKRSTNRIEHVVVHSQHRQRKDQQDKNHRNGDNQTKIVDNDHPLDVELSSSCNDHNGAIIVYRKCLSGDFRRRLDSKELEELESSLEDTRFTVARRSKKSNRPKKSEADAARLVNEAVQFAEAVGEMPPMKRNELCLIEEDADDDDDDDDDDDEKNTTQVHVDKLEQLELEKSLDNPAATPVRQKARPQWPFQKRFLETQVGQDYTYKGIHSYPLEIVKRGLSRGNHVQLHRKAWLEVSDKYHRYGKNLRLYYRHWEKLGYPTNMFFDWLDSKGEAAGQPLPNLPECPRSELDSDTVLYINNNDITEGYALKIIPNEDGKGRVVDIDGETVSTGPDGWIFVLRDNVIYGAQKITSITGHSKQRFHHSSFFGGKAVAAAGIIITDENGVLTHLYPHSGHYRPTEAHMQRLLYFLYKEGVDLRTFEVDTQQILHVAREEENVKKKKVDSLQLMSAVWVAYLVAHKAHFIGEGIFSQIHRIRKAHVTSVTEVLQLVD